MSKVGLSPREIALRALIEFYKTLRKPAIILNHIIPDGLSDKDRALAWEMTMGSIKLQKKMEFIAQSYIKAPFRQQVTEVKAALILGFYQLTEMSSVPDFAAVNETVSASKKIISEKSAGFVNAVLRAYLMNPNKVRFPDRNHDSIKYFSLFYSYPEWLVRRWPDRLGEEETELLLKAGNERPEISFKILESKKRRDEVKRVLSDTDVDIKEGNYFPDYFHTRNARKILDHALFEDGYLIVQDESQGVPVLLLDPPPGSVVLDLCAAPGGKSIALADRVGKDGRVVAVDFNPQRIEEFKRNIERTGFENIEIMEDDILEFNPEERYKYVLLDVPCSSLGTIAGNADLRWTKSEKDIMILSDMQKELLQKAARFVSVDGVIVYSTCTTEPEEIEDVIFGFLGKNPDFSMENGNSPLLEPFKTEAGIYRTWPHKHGIGGGGFARLKRSS